MATNHRASPNARRHPSVDCSPAQIDSGVGHAPGTAADRLCMACSGGFGPAQGGCVWLEGLRPPTPAKTHPIRQAGQPDQQSAADHPP